MCRNYLVGIFLSMMGMSTFAADNLPDDLSEYDGDSINIIFKVKDINQRSSVYRSSVTPLFSRPIKRNSQRLFNDIGLQRYYSIKVNKDIVDVKETISELRGLDNVEFAYLEPLLLPADINNKDNSLVVKQIYLKNNNIDNLSQRNKRGIGVIDVWDEPGGRGDGIDIINMECGSYFFNHEDLPYPFLALGDTSFTSYWGDHATKSAGVMASINNDYGTTGIAHNARLGWSGCQSKKLVTLAEQLSPGSVIQIGVQQYAYGDENSYCGKRCLVPVEWHQDWRDAIQYATRKGINVIIAAGNGNKNLDDKFFNNVFNREEFDSGAIYAAASDTFGNKAYYSNYGSRIDSSAWGFDVTTTQGGKLNDESLYTESFSGTSSANPIVAGAAAVLQGMATARGIPLTPIRLREILTLSGNQQADSKLISTLPNMVNAKDMLLGEQFIELFEHGNFNGRQILIKNDITEDELGDFNDQISSLKVPSGKFAILYYHDGFKGLSKVVTGNIAWIGSLFNDKVSSIQVRDKVIMLYSNSYYNGSSLFLSDSVPSLSRLGFGKNLSSIKFPEDVDIIIYSEENYRGESLRLVQDMPWLGSFNDRVASIRIVERSDNIVQLYEHAGFKGRSVTLTKDIPFLANFNDMASSIKMPSGVSVVVYEHANYKGKSIKYTGSPSWMRTFNDKVSSVRILYD